MPLLKSGEDGNMVADRAHFDLTLEIADSERQKAMAIRHLCQNAV